MANFFPPNRTVTPTKAHPVNRKTQQIETFSDQKQRIEPDQQRPFVERRKSQDRRDRKGSKRGMYDMRGGRGRRRTDRGGIPRVEMDV